MFKETWRHTMTQLTPTFNHVVVCDMLPVTRYPQPTIAAVDMQEAAVVGLATN